MYDSTRNSINLFIDLPFNLSYEFTEQARFFKLRTRLSTQ